MTSPPTEDGRVLRILGGRYHVELDDQMVECVLAGRLKQEGEERVAVGDRVRAERLPDGTGRVAEVRPRASKLARRSPTGHREQIIAANIDQVAAVFSVAEPEPDLRMLDRLLVLSELNDLDAFIVVNKADLGDPPAGLATRRDAGYEPLVTSAARGIGLEQLRERIRGHVTVLAGPSGAGKSSLLNALFPGLERRVGEVSRRAGRGRHTTVNAALLPISEGGGYVADTPGLQYLALWQMPPDELAHAFPEFRAMLGTCRFNDCRHLEEPGCGVRGALERGEIDGGRYESYRALLEEAEEQSQPW